MPQTTRRADPSEAFRDSQGGGVPHSAHAGRGVEREEKDRIIVRRRYSSSSGVLGFSGRSRWREFLVGPRRLGSRQASPAPCCVHACFDRRDSHRQTRVVSETNYMVYLSSFSDVEQISAQNLVVRGLAPTTVPRSSLHGHDKTRAAPIVACPNDLQRKGTFWLIFVSKKRETQ